MKFATSGGRILPLLVVTLAVIAIASWLVSRRSATTEAGSESWLPGLRAGLEQIEEVRIFGAGNRRQVTLKRGQSGFVVVERDEYPADVAKLRTLLLQLADARRLEAKTARVDRHAALGVEALDAETATGARIELIGPATPYTLVVGRTAEQLGGGTFVRRGNEPQSWLVSGAIVVEREPERWLETRIANISKERVARVDVRRGAEEFALVPARAADSPVASAPTDAETKLPANADTVDAEGEATTPPSEDAVFVIEGEDDDAMASEFVAEATVNALRELDLVDVRPRSAAGRPGKGASELRYGLRNGVTVIATAWQKDDTTYLQLDAEAAMANATGASGGSDAEPSGDGTATDAAAPGTLPAPGTDTRADGATAAAQAFNRQWQHWTYTVPPHVSAGLMPTRAALLKAETTP